MCEQIGYLELAGGAAGAVAAVLLALPTWRDIKNRERGGHLGRLAKLVVTSDKAVLDEIKAEHRANETAFRPEDRRDVLRGIALVLLAFVLPVLNKFAVGLWPKLQFCVG